MLLFLSHINSHECHNDSVLMVKMGCRFVSDEMT